MTRIFVLLLILLISTSIAFAIDKPSTPTPTKTDKITSSNVSFLWHSPSIPPDPDDDPWVHASIVNPQKSAQTMDVTTTEDPIMGIITISMRTESRVFGK